MPIQLRLHRLAKCDKIRNAKNYEAITLSKTFPLMYRFGKDENKKIEIQVKSIKEDFFYKFHFAAVVLLDFTIKVPLTFTTVVCFTEGVPHFN